MLDAVNAKAGVFDAARSADEAMRLAEETGQSLWAATARIAVALIDAVGKGWDTRHDLLSEAEQVAMRTPNAASSLLAGVQLARGIAELGAQGLSNREIGQRLFLSHRTVSSHLYRIFPKLGIASRNQLAVVLASPDGSHRPERP
jgi:ATP/maltotriose-dependent transcriptional regulator MalT